MAETFYSDFFLVKYVVKRVKVENYENGKYNTLSSTKMNP